MTESNVEKARRGYEAVVRGDLEAIRDLLDPDVKWHGGDPMAEYACQNREQAIAFMRQARTRAAMGEPVELILSSGDRLHIGPGADAATLRLVLGILREVR